MRVIFKDRCWVVHIPFVCMVKFKFLAHFLVDHLAHIVVVFHVSWWFFTEVWVTASLLKSLGFFSVFWPISTMLLFGWSSLMLSVSNLSVLISTIWWLYQEHPCFLYFSKAFWLSGKVAVLVSVLCSVIFTLQTAKTPKFNIKQVFLFILFYFFLVDYH